MHGNELCVPAGAVSAAGEDGAGVEPSIGDEVEVAVKGRVSRVEGGNVYLAPETANGQPIPEAKGGPMGMDEEGEMDAMMARAQEEQAYV